MTLRSHKKPPITAQNIPSTKAGDSTLASGPIDARRWRRRLRQVVLQSLVCVGHWATLTAVVPGLLSGTPLVADEATHRTDWLPRGHVTMNSNDDLPWTRPKIAQIIESHRQAPQYLDDIEPLVAKRAIPLDASHQPATRPVSKVAHLEPLHVPATLPDDLDQGQALPLVAPRQDRTVQPSATSSTRLRLTAADGDDPLAVFDELPDEVEMAPHDTVSVMQRSDDDDLPALGDGGELPDELPGDEGDASVKREADAPSAEQDALDAVFGDEAKSKTPEDAEVPSPEDDLPRMVDDANESQAPAEEPEKSEATAADDAPSETPAAESTDEETKSSDRVTEFNGRDCPEELGTLQKAWEELQRVPIQSISLDITPSIDPNESDEVAEKSRQRNMDAAPSREWRNRKGKVLARGRMVNFKDSKIIVADESGTNKELSWYELGNEELCFVTSWWELPSEFTPEADDFKTRQWTKITMTWTASAVCHKPLYFEDVQLERYGHSAAALRQAALSGAHFFGNIFFLPYHLGMNPPNECQYALGYYRPGSCAPWMLPAVPLSARGARMQVSALVGGLTLLP